MKFDREARIITLLVIDTIFFFVEITSGYAVGSLALISDAFHMLNDVMSLVVALYAVKLATKPSSAKNSYGWQRSEVLGALVNGVFLLALCFSIFMEAIERFFNVSEISNPKLVVIVGSLGLASNIIGLFLFHEHGHGGHSHGHSHDHPPSTVEAPIDRSPSPNGTKALPRSSSIPSRPAHGRGRSDSFGSLYGHPAQTRAAVIEAAHEYGYGRPSGNGSISLGGSAFSPRDEAGAGPLSPNSVGPTNGGINSFSHHARTKSNKTPVGRTERITEEAADHDHSAHAGHDHSHDEHDHDHAQAGAGKHAHDHDEAEAGHAHGDDDHGHSHGAGGGHGGHGHSHGNMNMRGVFLHVLGDALGNVGVIAAGLVIMFAEGHWKYYFDPAISLLITCIIFSSALPLVKSASYILLQGVPSHISLEAVRDAIKSCHGVVSLHELHIWQLSERSVVASVHVMVSRDVDYMSVADQIRKVLHEFGVHSSTIQPEFGNDDDELAEERACLIGCPPEACGAEACCPPGVEQLVDVDGQETAVASNSS
ncbi:cation efflux protein [Filobasidium floriforme]|uniref:cation efflux protein n=1 Tax=Filobasidium floriforme TaxID=5210 RepID=UPI001E8E119A|nr:cation efflux protein [Filobasidium floriforme]KAH8082235.1 cation efflux protein [Filobasidium floriforme]